MGLDPHSNSPLTLDRTCSTRCGIVLWWDFVSSWPLTVLDPWLFLICYVPLTAWPSKFSALTAWPSSWPRSRVFVQSLLEWPPLEYCIKKVKKRLSMKRHNQQPDMWEESSVGPTMMLMLFVCVCVCVYTGAWDLIFLDGGGSGMGSSSRTKLRRYVSFFIHSRCLKWSCWMRCVGYKEDWVKGRSWAMWGECGWE